MIGAKEGEAMNGYGVGVLEGPTAVSGRFLKTVTEETGEIGTRTETVRGV